MARIERTVGRGRRLIASVTATAMLTGGLVVTSAAVAMPAGADAPSCKAAGKPTSAQLNSTTGITKTSVSVGNISIITGPVPGLFQGAAYGAQAYFDYINSQGGVNGRKIDYHSYDDAFSGTTNQSLATQAVSKDFALAGSFSLFDSFSCNVLASNPAMPDVSVTLDSATNSLANVFSPQPLGSGGSEAGYRYLKSKYPNAVKAVGNLYSNVDTAIAQWHGQEALMKHVGYKIAYQRAVSPVETNFAADVVNFKKNHVQFVFITDGTAQIYAALVKEMRKQNFKPQVIMSAGPIYTPDFVTQAGGAANANGIWNIQGQSLYLGQDAKAIPAVKTFNTWVQKAHKGFKPDLFTLYGWASAQLFAQALKAAGPSPTRGKVLTALGKIQSFSASNLVAPSNPAKKIPANCVVFTQVKNGKFARTSPSGSKGFYCKSPYWDSTKGTLPKVNP